MPPSYRPQRASCRLRTAARPSWRRSARQQRSSSRRCSPSWPRRTPSTRPLQSQLLSALNQAEQAGDQLADQRRAAHEQLASEQQRLLRQLADAQAEVQDLQAQLSAAHSQASQAAAEHGAATEAAVGQHHAEQQRLQLSLGEVHAQLAARSAELADGQVSIMPSCLSPARAHKPWQLCVVLAGDGCSAESQSGCHQGPARSCLTAGTIRLRAAR